MNRSVLVHHTIVSNLGPFLSDDRAQAVVDDYLSRWLGPVPSSLGRVTSLVGLANLGLTPLSYALSGALVDLNPTLMFALAGGLVLAAFGLAGTSATVRGLE